VSADQFLLLASFAQALAHRIRTPLTVITNELSFLSSQGHDCGRAVQRSKDIVEVLKTACLLGSVLSGATMTDSSVIESEADLGNSLRKVFPELKLPESLTQPFFIAADALAVEITLRLIKRLLADLHDGGADSTEVAAPIFTIAEKKATLEFTVKLHDPISVAQSFDSLTELFAVNLHLDLIEPPLIDAGAMRCKMTIAASLDCGMFRLSGSWDSCK